MKNFFGVLAITALFCSVQTNGHAGERVGVSQLSDRELDSELIQSRRDTLLAPIKSTADLYSFMQNTPKRENPLSALSTQGRDRFLDSLVFTENGLGGFSSVDLSSELSATQTYKILSLFGVQRTAPMVKGVKVLDDTDRAIMVSPALRADHEGYACTGRGTCSLSAHDICTSNC